MSSPLPPSPAPITWWRRWRRRIGVVAAALLLIGLAGWFALPRIPLTLAPPPAGDAQVIEDQLGRNQQVDAPPSLRIQSWILQLPTGLGDFGTLQISRLDAALPAFGPLRSPPDTLDRPGLYVSVGYPDGRLAYVTEVTDPRVSRSETIGGGGEFEIEVDAAAGGGALAVRVPFVRRGMLRLFEVDDSGHVARVLLKLPFGRRPFPGRGRRFRVPFS